MVSAVTSKPNHYERLGLSPDASMEEVARAFATAMSPLMPRTVSDMVEIALAFDTLRDPVKRKAYDASIAPPPEPEPTPEAEPKSEPKLMFPREGWPVTPSVRIRSPELPAIDALAGPAPKPEPGPATDSSLPERPHASEPQSAFPPATQERFRYAEQASVEWRRPAAILAALFAGVAVIGAGLGWYASRGIAPAQAEQPIAFPAPKAEEPVAESPVAVPLKKVKPAPERRPEPAPARTRKARVTPPLDPVVSEPKRAEEVPDLPSEQVAATVASQDQAIPATMPLPDAVVARTIRRIGFACGEVASTSAVDGAPGVFKVTCSSGESYKASPVHGRYHFRRWAGN